VCSGKRVALWNVKFGSTIIAKYWVGVYFTFYVENRTLHGQKTPMDIKRFIFIYNVCPEQRSLREAPMSSFVKVSLAARFY
jgi:hypothetical protein